MLKDRSLVTLSREPGGRAGVDRYGPLAPRLGRDRGWSRYEDYGSEVPTAAVGTAGDPPIAPRGEPQPFYRLKRDVEYIHDGMPTGLSLRVWLPESRRSATAAGRRRPGNSWPRVSITHSSALT